MDDVEIEDLFSCPICSEIFIDAMLLQCSHTLCKACLDRILKTNSLCPTCKRPIDKDKIIPNPLLNRIVKFYLLLKNCTDVFLNFPLKFKYCVDCKVFITNYTFKKHKMEKHYLFTFDKIFQSYFEGKNINFNNDMFIVLYFYLNPFLHEIKCLEQKGNTFYFGNNNFIFNGKQRNFEENKFLMKLMKNKYEESEAIKWYKGTLIKRKNWFFIHGYFLFKSIKGEAYIQPNIFGFLSYGDIKFFGFIKINKNYINKTEPLEIKDFTLDCGILFNKNYYFGTFNDINIENLSKIDKDDSNIKILNGGEIFILKEGNNIEVKIIKPEEIQEIPPKMTCELEPNKLSIYYEYKDEVSRFEIEPFYFQKDENNNRQPFEEYELVNCKINFKNYNRTLIFDRREYIIYLFKNEENKNLQLNKYKTKVLSIYLKDNILQFLSLKTRIIKYIINEKVEDKSNFYYTLKKILEMNLNQCQIKYYLSEIKDGEIKLNEFNYYEISGCEVTPKNQKMNKLSYKDNTLEKIKTIEDFLNIELTSEIYNFKTKEETICSACDII